MIVILTSDAEGNSYSPLASADIGTYLPESTWSGEGFPDRGELYREDYGVDPDDPNLIDALILGPVN